MNADLYTSLARPFKADFQKISSINSQYLQPASHWDSDDSDDALFTEKPVLRNSLDVLRDRRLRKTGDLGWSMSYATAWLFSFLNSNRFAVIDAIDDARSISTTIRAPFILFETLGTYLFGGKLSGMILMVWKARASSNIGTTYATQKAAQRICIELNSTPFEQGTGDMALLLEMLIHQMIHAYFLVCCGSQDDGESQDGRLLDGLQFGVIVATLNDITRQCARGTLGIIFHAAERQGRSKNRSRATNKGGYIQLDPSAMSMGAPRADGRSHCMLDNRSITRAQVNNWQIQDYAKAISDDWDSRGEHVLFYCERKFRKLRRLDACRSRHYKELIFKNDRYALPTHKASLYSAISKLAEGNKYGDMKVPDCDGLVFTLFFEFLMRQSKWNPRTYEEDFRRHTSRVAPPLLLTPTEADTIPLVSSKTPIRLCKLADQLKFVELQQYALQRLYGMEYVSDDPVTMLEEIYDQSKPLSIELQTWVRRFLSRQWKTDEDSNTGNMLTIRRWHNSRFMHILSHIQALRDDCEHLTNTVALGGWPHHEDFYERRRMRSLGDLPAKDRGAFNISSNARQMAEDTYSIPPARAKRAGDVLHRM